MAEVAPRPHNPSEPVSEEAAFRESLADVIVVLESMAPNFERVDDLVDSLKLSLENDGLLRMFLGKVTKRKR
jgi:hypothetical protein